MRRGQLPPAGHAPEVLAIAIALLGVVLLGIAIGHQLA